MSKPRRLIPATELRVHLGEALKGLEDEDIVVMKGGLPVAMLVRYRREETDMARDAAAKSYQHALSKQADPAGWDRALIAMQRGWAGVSADALTANIYRWRQEGATLRYFSPSEGDGGDDEGEQGDGSSTLSGGQRYLQPRPQETKLTADERAEWNPSGRAGD